MAVQPRPFELAKGPKAVTLRPQQLPGSSFSLGRAPRVCPAPSRELVAGALVSFKQRVDHHAQRSRAPVA